jgi:hypothetical protein
MTTKKLLPLLLPIRCLVFPIIFIIGAAVTGQNVADISNWWSVIASVVNIGTIVLLILAARCAKSNYWTLINFQKGQTKVGQVISVTLAILIIGMLGMYLAGWLCYGKLPYAAPMMIAPIPLWLAIVNVIILPVSTAFAEDGLYLGCGVNQIRNKYAAIVIPAFFFALQHSFIPTLFDLRYIIYRFLSFQPLTIILCLYYYKRRNPVPIMIGHAVIDVATVMQILATSAVPGLFEKMCEW